VGGTEDSFRLIQFGEFAAACCCADRDIGRRGTARKKPYGFGVRVSLTMISNKGLMVRARPMSDTPYARHAA
jgi:hypothetical protein